MPRRPKKPGADGFIIAPGLVRILFVGEHDVFAAVFGRRDQLCKVKIKASISSSSRKEIPARGRVVCGVDGACAGPGCFLDFAVIRITLDQVPSGVVPCCG